MKKVGIIGPDGQLGSALLATKNPSFSLEGYTRLDLDITSKASVEKFLASTQPHILINTAAFHVVADCDSKPLEALKINCAAVHNLATACRKHNILFVTYSTDYVFDGKKGEPYVEDDCSNPLQMYGISKLAGEYAALAAHPQSTLVIRTCGVYGGMSGSRAKGGNFALNIIKEAQAKPQLEVSSEQIVSPTSAQDLAEATLKLLGKEAKPGVYHLVNEGTCSWYEFTKAILENAIINTPVEGVDRGGNSAGVNRPVYSALANTKARALGVVLPPWQDAIKRYIKELKA